MRATALTGLVALAVLMLVQPGVAQPSPGSGMEPRQSPLSGLGGTPQPRGNLTFGTDWARPQSGN